MSDGHAQRAHSLLSASGSERWMSCTPSARKEENIKDTESVFAKEGTLAHELGELELRYYYKMIPTTEYKVKLRAITEHELFTSDMPDHVDVYVSYCIERVNHYKSICTHVEISIEEKIDLTEYIPEGFGSNDFVIVADNFIEVVDLKYGRGVLVSAVRNSQLMLYGLGSVFRHRLSYKMNEVQLTVIQPRTSINPSSFVMKVDELENWADTEVRTKAKLAFAGEGEFNPGSWCKWCKFKPKCRAVYDDNVKLMKQDFGDPSELTDDEVLEVFEKIEQIVGWTTSVSAYVMDKLLKKKPIGNYKLVKGRSNRIFKDKEAVIKKLESLKIHEDEYLSERKLLGITAIEKVLGKKDFGEKLGDLVDKTEPKPAIAKLDDKRESFFSSAESDFS